MQKKLIFVNNCLPQLRNKVDSNLILDAKFLRFQDGTGKVVLPSECRGEDVYVICDVNDKSINPTLGRGLSPDEHVRDLGRIIGALKSNPSRRNLIVPFQPYGRQHRRVKGESTEAADFLRECHFWNFQNILTVDSHDPDVAAAISKHNFDNMFITNKLLTELVTREEIDYFKPEDILIVAPDEGAQQRARHFADRFGCNHSFFSKRRNLNEVVDGKNPIESKVYVGFDPAGKTVILVDDMIASGGSILETAKELKMRGAREIYICATFGLFTEGLSKFAKYQEDKIIDRVYVSNLTYCEHYFELESAGIIMIDSTEQILDYIDGIHNYDVSMDNTLGVNLEPVKKLVMRRED